MKHIDHSKKSVEYFQRLLNLFSEDKFLLKKYVSAQEKYMLWSYQPSYLIEKSKSPYKDYGG